MTANCKTQMSISLGRKPTLGATALAEEKTDDFVLSALRNWICPECGRGLRVFMCLGQCHRDWHGEWLRLCSSPQLNHDERLKEPTRATRAPSYSSPSVCA